MHGYSMLVDRFGNRFEVIIEKRDEELCFTHGSPEVANCYLDDEVMWASLPYIRPKLFVLIVQDRYYRNVFGRHMYSNLCVSLSRSLFGRDEYPIPGEQIRMPYRHDDRDFTHIFIVVLIESDIYSGYLVCLLPS
ncbi:hypothetical protein TSUD_139820 [Trifolium subterraneum]|uniref:Uncharacterized protein n=1 Tax=Trifolium subterraneum TaxID=3900 RepID=A0A2Z6PA79_TRISU|nr:hypothetical protein TSUD_139820 [Trifolium subterraneum]